jgi:hypothetical protein
VVYGTALEKRPPETERGFKSRPLRQRKFTIDRILTGLSRLSLLLGFPFLHFLALAKGGLGEAHPDGGYPLGAGED